MGVTVGRMDNARSQRLLTGDQDPFGGTDREASFGATEAVRTIPRSVTERFPGRWVLLRGFGEPEVIADADRLQTLLSHPYREPTDVTAFVRDPRVAYG